MVQNADSANRPVTNKGPLEGIRIVAFTQFLLGPAGTQYLADLGAEVIKVERPGSGAWERNWAGADSFINGESVFFLMTHRGAKSVALDLRSDEDIDVVRNLVSTADIVVENFRPGVMERLGLSYEDLVVNNPTLIYISASGYGESSRLRELPGQDILLQAMSGLMNITGTDSAGPTPVGAPVVDQHAASLLAMSACAALVRRMATGKGDRIEVSMLEAALDLQMEPFVYWLNGAELGRPTRTLGSTFHPAPYGVYNVQDGHIVISLSSWREVHDAIADYLGHGTIAEKVQDADLGDSLDDEDIHARLSTMLSECSAHDIVMILRNGGVWAAPVMNYQELLELPGIEDLNLVHELDHPVAGRIRLLRHPVRYESGLPTVHGMPPSVGEHTQTIRDAVKDRSDGLGVRDNGSRRS